MSVDVHVSAERVRVPVALARVEAIARAVLRAEGIRNATLSYTFVTRRAMASLNRRHLGHRGATDIITFEFTATAGGALGGDVYIAPEVARDHAIAFGRPVREELGRLVVHGTLHAIGYTHPDDAGREASVMWTRQERYVARLVSAVAGARA